MWRKIHSNRDPRDTLYSEVRKEFGTYFSAAGNGIRTLLNANPKLSLAAMIIMMLVSATLSFTVFRQPEAKQVAKLQTVDPVGDGFTRLWETASMIKESLRLKRHIDSISSKKRLNATDSMMLENALDSLQHLQQKRHEN
jgi:hypothetical protein